MRIHPCALVIALTIFSTQAVGQAAHPSAPTWRNYRRAAAPFSTDSAACLARTPAATSGMSGAARTEVYESCLTDRGWYPMQVVASHPTCAPVHLQSAGSDSASAAPLRAELTATLTRRFRPASADDSSASLILTVSDSDLRARASGLYPTGIPLAARLAVAGAKQELPQFTTRPGATPIEFVADFHPKCVVEFPWTARPVPTEQAYFEFQVTTPVRQLSGKPPVYPPALLESHIDGRVLAQFVVDTSGIPDMRTFKILESTGGLFSAAVRDAVPGLRFVPAKLEGRRVRQVVQQPFNFAVR
jgi:hypothetical protein